MRYKFNFPSKSVEYFSSAVLLLVSLIIDICITFIIDVLLFLPFLYVIGEIYEFATGVIEVPNDYTNFCIITVCIIEFIIMLAIEIKRRFVYCKFTAKGIYIYNNNGARFGYGKLFRKNATIPYDRINACYISKADFVPKNYGNWITFIFGKIKKAIYNRNGYEYIPAVANGDYQNDCIILELKNMKGIALPLDNCEQFLSEYESIINSSSISNT